MVRLIFPRVSQSGVAVTLRCGRTPVEGMDGAFASPRPPRPFLRAVLGAV